MSLFILFACSIKCYLFVATRLVRCALAVELGEARYGQL
jgi:hypothetical protein